MTQANIRKLDNGITLITENIEGLGTFSMGFIVKTGAIYETKQESGISHFIEHLMFKGTKTRTAKEISELVDYEGGSINAFTSRDVTCYYIKMLSSKMDIAIDILSDMFLNSNFDEENIEKERNVIIEEIRMYEDIPEEIVHEKNIEFALRGVHSNSITGTIDSLKKITRNDILKYLEDQYTADNLIITVSGTINEEELYEKLNNKMNNFRKKIFDRNIDMSYEIKSGENLVKKDTNQIHLCFTTRGVSIRSKYKYAMNIISNILAGGMSSRLFQKIREERGLAYSVYSYLSSFVNCGIFSIYAGTTKEDYLEVIKIIREELDIIKKDLVTEKELQKAKNQAKSELIFGLENTKSRMIFQALYFIENRKLLSLEELIEKYDTITMEDIKETLDFVFNEDYYSYTIVGDVGGNNG